MLCCQGILDGRHGLQVLKRHSLAGGPMEIDDEDGSTPFGRNSCGPRVGFRCNTRLPLGRPPAITVADQSIKNNSVNVASASLDKPDYLVVHLADPNGKIIGALAVPAGEHKNLAVPLTLQVVHRHSTYRDAA